MWRFDNKELLDYFVTTSDRDHREGFSTCSLEMSKAGRALFSGNIDVRPPKDGRVTRSGYCAMRTKRARVCFIYT